MAHDHAVNALYSLYPFLPGVTPISRMGIKEGITIKFGRYNPAFLDYNSIVSIQGVSDATTFREVA